MSTLLNLGFTVARTIPPEVVIGLITGQYKIYGGVIRWAPGTPKAGQIVIHLIPIATEAVFAPLFTPITTIMGAVNIYQINQLQKSVNTLSQQVLQMATNTMALSGLNLAVSSVGFAVLNQKLNLLDQKLNEIQKDVKEIKDFLQLKQRAELLAALRELANIGNVPLRIRDDILLSSKEVLASLSLQYQERLTQANSLQMAMVAEECYCVTTLAHTRCMAELGIAGVNEQLDEAKKVWQIQTKRIAKDMIFGNSRERFLSSDFVTDVPTSILVEWLDFTYNETNGYEWVDELRRETKPTTIFTPKNQMDKERNLFIPSIQKLVARNNVLEGHVIQYELLGTQKITPSQFEKEIAQIPAKSVVDRYVILEPKSSWFR